MKGFAATENKRIPNSGISGIFVSCMKKKKMSRETWHNLLDIQYYYCHYSYEIFSWEFRHVGENFYRNRSRETEIPSPKDRALIT